MFTCVGRRVELLGTFRSAARKLRIDLELLGVDRNALAPAMRFVDRGFEAPETRHQDYIDRLLGLVRRHRPDLLIPLIDLDLLSLARAREAFAEAGCRCVISSYDVVRTCRDKIRCWRFLSEHGIDTPRTWTYDQARELGGELPLPLFIKPRSGSASRGNHRADTLDELAFYGPRVPEAIVQEFVTGQEYTLDVYAGLDGRPRCVVPRKRIEVRDGEVSKGEVVKDSALIAVGRHVVEALGECVGVVTIQCIVGARGRVRVIEINPRFGGGAPLGIAAGAEYPRWLLAEHLGRRVRIAMDGYRDGLRMLRYDSSVFEEAARAPAEPSKRDE